MGAVLSVSLLAGLLTYSIFFIFCLVNLRRGITGRALLFASTLTLLWLGTTIFSFTNKFYLAVEPLALTAWLVLLVRALGLKATLAQPVEMRPVGWIFVSGIILGAAASGAAVGTTLGAFNSDMLLAFHALVLVINVLGLVLIEQLSRNTVSDFRWRIRYLNIGLGMMFAFGLIHHAVAILIKQPLVELLVLQPAVMALAVPFVIIASLRNRQNKLRFSLSRSFVFRSGVLVTTGTFLLLLSLFGYLVQIFAGDIGSSVAVFAAIVAVTFFLVVVGSTRFRRQLRVILSKTFFEYRYDYRDEWMKVTAQLTEPDVDFDLPQQAQRTILAVLNARQSCLWTVGEHGSFLPLSDIEAAQWRTPLPLKLNQAISEFYEQHDWVLDLEDMPEAASAIKEEISNLPDSARISYLVPFFVESDLYGICLTGPAEASVKLVWEDFDILKLIGKQCAAFLALQSANQSLLEGQKLAAVSQMSAFLLHDIKTIAAQLSLMLDNAPKYKDRPEFVDDMLMTIKNSVDKMERIIAGLRDPQAQSPVKKQIDLGALLQERSAMAVHPNITYSDLAGDVIINCDADALNNALTHLEKNAFEAIDNDGAVQIKAEVIDGCAFVFVSDTGHGMSEEFLKDELFKPFHSSKGLTGMGIGAYQAREKIRSCGGDLQVDSKVGLGTTFTIKLPLAIDA